MGYKDQLLNTLLEWAVSFLRHCHLPLKTLNVNVNHASDMHRMLVCHQWSLVQVGFMAEQISETVPKRTGKMPPGLVRCSCGPGRRNWSTSKMCTVVEGWKGVMNKALSAACGPGLPNASIFEYIWSIPSLFDHTVSAWFRLGCFCMLFCCYDHFSVPGLGW